MEKGLRKGATFQSPSAGQPRNPVATCLHTPRIVTQISPSCKTCRPRKSWEVSCRATGLLFFSSYNLNSYEVINISNRRDRRSKTLRQDPLFIRNEYNGECLYDIPGLAKCEAKERSIQLISFKSIKADDFSNVGKAVHFFIDDADCRRVYNNPKASVKKLAQYQYVLTPDFSLYRDMPIWMQITNVAKSRWCGRYWQDLGIPVIPTVSWSTKPSYEFAFLGLAHGTAVAVSTLGVRSGKIERELFLAGYAEMMVQIAPEMVYCYSRPFPEMDGNVVWIDYLETTRRAS